MNKQNRVSLLHFLTIAGLCLAAYANTWHVPFILDDKYVIVDNPITHDPGYILRPWEARKFQGHFEYPSFQMRYTAYASFALNYALHGLALPGYHAVNIFCHILTALAAYLLSLQLWNTPVLRKAPLANDAPTLSLIIAALFSVHPVQTAAVTYIWQRTTILCALFYLTSVICYLRARLTNDDSIAPSGNTLTRKTHFRIYYALALVSCLLATRTKENAVTIPFMIMGLEFLLFQGPIAKRLGHIIPFFLVTANIGISVIGGSPTAEGTGHTSDAPFGRLPYLLTQFRVLMTYLRLFFWPADQHLMYDTPLYTSFGTPAVWSSFLVHLGILCGTVRLLVLALRRKITIEWLPVSIGILWFYGTISIESSIFPLIDLVFEHRMYLPGFGLFLSLVIASALLAKRLPGRDFIRDYSPAIAAAPVIAILLVTTIARNAVWATEESLWQDNLAKAPKAAMAYYQLGMLVAQRQDFVNAAVLFKQAAGLARNSSRLSCQTSALNNLGNCYFLLGNLDDAKEAWQASFTADPRNPMALYNIGMTEDKQGNLPRALDYYRQFITHSAPNTPASVIERVKEIETQTKRSQ